MITVPRAATFSCIPCVPCNLSVRPEAAKAYAAPPTESKTLPSCVCPRVPATT